MDKINTYMYIRVALILPNDEVQLKVSSSMISKLLHSQRQSQLPHSDAYAAL